MDTRLAEKRFRQRELVQRPCKVQELDAEREQEHHGTVCHPQKCRP